MIRYTKYLILSAALFICANTDMSAQEDSLSLDYEAHKEIGLNFTQFVSQFVPFNIKSVKDGPIGYSYKYYNSRNMALRFGFGANISFLDNFTNSHMAIRLGYEKRKHLTGRFYYTKGIDFLGIVGGFNSPNKSENGTLALGVGPVIGIEYHITDEIIFTTESMLFMGISSFTIIDISIIPPSAFFVHFRF